MKAKNATAGTRVQHKTTGRLGTIVDGPVDKQFHAAVCYDDGPPDRALPVQLENLRRAPRPIPFPEVSCRRGGVRYRQPRPAYLLPGVHEDTDPYLAERVRELGAEFGPVVVAIVAAQLTDPNYLIARLLNTGYRPPQRGAEQQPDVPGPVDGAAPADGPALSEAVLRLLPLSDAELLCVVRNIGRVPIAVYDATGDRVTAVAPDVTLQVPRSWAMLPSSPASQPADQDSPDPWVRDGFSLEEFTRRARLSGAMDRDEDLAGFIDHCWVLRAEIIASERLHAEQVRSIQDAAWTEGYQACREGRQPHSPYREPRPAADD